ncbi:DUF11 domain-containing protein [Leucobacter soli]|uniref:DUF11 domain-containing protein n=1 Tax=Leucobacter soli TaxID=2812850 RepID=A0A916JX14_9MICO|nr:DUF11 domain-containing protein [Leucobacter soli]CAG7607485.1 hypothetical protein LEUCIP111803_01028 [Leucobacter soli]
MPSVLRFAVAAALSTSVVFGLAVPVGAFGVASAVAVEPVVADATAASSETLAAQPAADQVTPEADPGAGAEAEPGTAPERAETEGSPEGGEADVEPEADGEVDAASGDSNADAPAAPENSGRSGAASTQSNGAVAGTSAVGISPRLAAAGIGDGCSYADPNTGAYASTLCWLNFSGVTTEWVLVSTSAPVTITSTEYNNCTYQISSGSSGTYQYRRTTMVYASALGAAYGTQTFTGCGRARGGTTAVNGTNAGNNSLEAVRQARDAALYRSTTGNNDTGPVYGSVTNYPVEFDLSTTYVFRANLNLSSPANNRGKAVASRPFPTWSGSFLGNNGFYTGVAGEPALYQIADGGTSANDKTSVVSLSDVRVQHKTTNAKQTGFSLVVADAESTDNNEQITWTHSGGAGFLWLPNSPGTWSNTGTNTAANTARKAAGVGNACAATNVDQFPQNSNTTATATSRTCSAGTSQPSPKTGTAMLQISPANASNTFTVTQTMVGGGLQAVAFGVVLAGAKVNVEVEGRVLDASGNPTTPNFTAELTASGYGSFTAETGTGVATTGTSGSQFFPLSTQGTSSLAFSSATPSHATGSSYTKSWFCEKSTGSNPVREQWSGNGGATPPGAPWTQLSGGQFIECTVTYTPPFLTLVKVVNQAGTAAANAPADFTLTATGRNAPVSRVQGAGGSTSIITQPVAIGTYDFSETQPGLGSPNWQYGYTWSDLVCTGGGTANVTKDATSGQVTAASLAVGTSQNVICTYTNTANQPKLTLKKEAYNASGALLGRDTPVNAGDTITYRLTLDNSTGSAAQTAGHVDYLRDVLDDAAYVSGSIRYGSSASTPPASTTPITPTGITATPQDLTGTNPRLAITGTVPAFGVRTISFQVTVKANTADAAERQTGTSATTGYLLRNHLVESGDPVPTTCQAPPSGEDPTCTQHPVRAWTISKDSQPEDGAMIHSGGNIYYRVKITNYSGEDLTGVQVVDDMTQTLAAAYFDRYAPPAVGLPNGISFYDTSGVRITGAAAQAYEKNWSLGAQPGTDAPPAIGFAADGTGGCSVSAKYQGATPPLAARGCWTLTSPTFTVPAQIGGTTVGYAILGYAVKGGSPARVVGGTGTADQIDTVVPVDPAATWVNTVQAGTANAGGQSIYPNRCSASGPGVPPGDVSGYYDCKTWHSLGESYFHIWKKFGPVPTETDNNLTGAAFLLADTEADARAGNASRWLCRTEYAVPNPNDPNSVPAATVGSSAGQGTLDFGADSATFASIELANKTRALYNFDNGLLQPGDAGYKPQLPQCGLFFELEGPGLDQGQQPGTWRAKDVRGGDTVAGGSDPLPNWRTDSAFNNGADASAGRHGTYWVAETRSPTDFQLLAQPFELWVAPNSPTPAGLSPGQTAWYDYQGRLSLPTVGLGENSTGVPGMGGTDALNEIRQVCVDPYQLPAHNQPNCVMPTGWTMPVFDVKLAPLPLTGGQWLGALTTGGATVLIAALGGMWWWRSRQHAAATDPSAPGGDTP